MRTVNGTLACINPMVVINLFPERFMACAAARHPEFKHRFDTTAPTPARIIDAYESLVRNIRNKYPKANIICALGSMDATRRAPLARLYIKSGSQHRGQENNHAFLSVQNSPGHPSVAEQQAMADDLVHYIETTIKW